MKRLLNNALLHFCIGLITLLLLHFKSDLFFVHSSNFELFNKQLNEKEILADNLLREIQKSADKKKLFEKSDHYSDIFKKNGIAFFITENGKRTFWTDRSIFFSRDLSELKKEKGAVLLKNGWYLYLKQHVKDTTYIALTLVKNQFNIKNKYLEDNFHSSFKLSNTIEINSDNGFPIKSINGDILFYLENNFSNSSFNGTNWLVVFSFFFGYILIISSLSKKTRKINPLKKNYPFFIIAFVIISKVILSYFHYPSVLFKQELFSPNIYAHSNILPSLGDFLITSLFFFIVVFYINEWGKNGLFKNKYTTVIFIVISAILTLILADCLRGLIINSKINFDVNYLPELNSYSFIGFLSILLFFVSIIVLVKTLFNSCADKLIKQTHFQNVYWIVSLVIIITGHFFLNLNALLSSWFLIILIIFSIKPSSKTVFYKGILFVLIISLTIFYGFIHFEKKRENLTKEFWAKRIAKEKDPITEYLFEDIKLKIEKDAYLANQLDNYWENSVAIENYIKDRFFGGFWNKYDIRVYPCLGRDTLIIKDENRSVSCLDFFMDKIDSESDDPFGSNKDINYLYSKNGISSYLGKISVKKTSNSLDEPVYLFLEFVTRTLSKSEGYPELLLNQKEISKTVNLNKFSFAKYKRGKLFTNSGAFNYSTNLNKNFRFDDKGFSSFTYEGFNHLVYRSDKFTTVILSSRKKTIFNYITTFSYLFISVGLLILLIGLFIRIDPFKWLIAFTDVSTKIQLFVISSMFLSFVLFSWGTSYYIKKQYLVKNNRNINEKVQSVLIELEHKLGDKTVLDTSLYDDMTYYLVKFSNVFYTDINLYNKNGDLLASSRPEIFETGLTSRRMNLDAYYEMNIQKKSTFIHNEKIGKLNYLSAYVPFRNKQNKILAYMNLPYFAKQNELENELLEFFTALINIYGLLFLISAIIAVFFANYISEPVRMIKEKISQLQLGKSYDLIDWQSNDEIGSLVSEYNKKVLELEKNALKLAKSERESAWREMAKQVAHEIKNPLTPMKLSIQHLQRSAKDSTINLSDRINRTTQTLIEQIDTLTNIANEFSNFAKMPKANDEVIDLLPIIETTIDLYKDEKYNLSLELNKIKTLNVLADKNQMSRIFNNVIKNAIQAIPEGREGYILLKISEQEGFFQIEVKDNGVGIADDKKEQIFVPNFTTKTGGMGLGLAMVKNILKNINGEVWFTTTLNEGTSFFMKFPKA